MQHKSVLFYQVETSRMHVTAPTTSSFVLLLVFFIPFSRSVFCITHISFKLCLNLHNIRTMSSGAFQLWLLHIESKSICKFVCICIFYHSSRLSSKTKNATDCDFLLSFHLFYTVSFTLSIYFAFYFLHMNSS